MTQHLVGHELPGKTHAPLNWMTQGPAIRDNLQEFIFA